MVEAMNTRYGPSSFFTNGSGIAAASSITTSSACSSLCESPALMYYERDKKVSKNCLKP